MRFRYSTTNLSQNEFDSLPRIPLILRRDNRVIEAQGLVDSGATVMKKNRSEDKFIAFEAYETLAEAYALSIDTKPHNADYERPATLSLLPDVREKRVLDAGCGPGAYSEWLIAHSAEVVAIDASPKMVELAKKRLGTLVNIHLADLRNPLDFLENAAFDIVLAPLVMDYVKDWQSVFSEFNRILRESGLLIFSVEHPFAKFTDHQRENYFLTERVEVVWKGFGDLQVTMPSYRRPLSAMISALASTGFRVEQILEPLPTETFKHKDPKDYEELSKQPGFMCIRAKKA